MKYKLTITEGNHELIFKTLKEGITALLSKWYYDRFPYRWYTDEYGNTIIVDDYILDYNKRKDRFIEKYAAELQEIGHSISLEGLVLTVIED